jgi:site-specific DNA-methyltransferase (adenine-specific)
MTTTAAEAPAAAQPAPHLPSQIEHLATAALVPYARNSRTHSPEQVAAVARSIQQFGFTNPVLIDARNTIIAGHGRVMAAQQLGLALVPCIRMAHLTDAQRRAYVIADNKLAELSGWDMATLAREVEDLMAESFEIDLLGFGAEDLEALLAEHAPAPQPETTPTTSDADQAPEPPATPVSQPGDVWLCGKHRVMCGDSTNLAAANVLMAGKKADLLLTDPPYNVAYEGKTADALVIENDSMSDADFRQFLVNVYKTADAVMKPGAVFYIWHADKEGLNFRLALTEVPWKSSQLLLWAKNSLVLGRWDYHAKHEPCLYGWKEGAAHYWGSDRKQTTVLNFDRPQRNGEHPTMKPVALFQYQVENSSKPGGTVLDLFGGSGTTLIACENTKRQARLMELDPKYVDVIIRRWQDFTGRQATLEATGQTFNQVRAQRTGAAE